MLYEFQNLQRRRFGHAVDIYEDFYPSIRSRQIFCWQNNKFIGSRIQFPNVFPAILSLDSALAFEYLSFNLSDNIIREFDIYLKYFNLKIIN